LERVLVDYNLIGATAQWSALSDDKARLTLRMKLARVHLYELLAEIVDVPDVSSISQESCPVVKAIVP
jgi:hypothetical protein